MARKIIIDTDAGIDDAIALTMALFDERLDVLAVTAVGGNVGAEQATQNVQAIINLLDPPKLPRIGKAVEPESGPTIRAHHVWGKDGLGDSDFPVVELHNLHTSDKILYEEVKAHPHEVTILTIGPLTNIATVIQRDPDWLSLVGELVIMGGAVESPGNITPTAEFNIYSDPDSARLVFKSPVPKTLVPLDVTHKLVVPFDFLQSLPDESSRAGMLLHQLIPFAFRTHRQVFGIEGMYAHDAIALTAALSSELFEMKEMSGDVETLGELTLGATIFDRRSRASSRPNMTVARNLKTEQVYDEIQRSLQRAAARSAR
ncbi:MAG TPA: nucleoside hydrolase [Pirellulales bacterium]